MPECLGKCLCMPRYTAPNLKITSLWYISFKGMPQCSVKSLIDFELVTNFTKSLISPWFWKKSSWKVGEVDYLRTHAPSTSKIIFSSGERTVTGPRISAFSFYSPWIAASEFLRQSSLCSICSL